MGMTFYCHACGFFIAFFCECVYLVLPKDENVLGGTKLHVATGEGIYVEPSVGCHTVRGQIAQGANVIVWPEYGFPDGQFFGRVCEVR